VKPNVIGEQVMEVDLDILVPYIDWTPFLELAIVRKISSNFDG
jgi:cobalamin-dependent methionine synthase I